MGQACCTDDIQVQYKGNMLKQQSSINKNDPAFLHIPQQLPIVQTPMLNQKVMNSRNKLQQFQSQIQNYERGVYSKARRINALGVVYEGEWKNMSPHGKGKMYFPDGAYYEGFFFNGTPDGEGRLINSYGIFYQGQVKNGKAIGQGQLINEPKQYYYQGQWKDDVPHGFGKQIFGNLSQYEGNFDNGMKQGQGIYKKTNDFEYKGDFHNNLFHGYGEIHYTNGDSYLGNWKNGLFHGQGVYTYVNKQKNKMQKYSGHFLQGYKDGKGKYTDSQGRIFEGTWQLGKRKGKGRLYQKNEIIQWNWNNDKAIKKSKS